MTTCRSCGWEIKKDFGDWVDVFGGLDCGNQNHSPFSVTKLLSKNARHDLTDVRKVV